jgi:sterol desaturase/sphingolipid hydroxylase (fatty acid hydroxylase superfamily)
MVLFIDAVIAFLTWLMLGFAGADPLEAAIGTALVFVAVGATLVHYVLGCMRRHCRHDPEKAHHPHHPRSVGIDKAAGGRV